MHIIFQFIAILTQKMFLEIHLKREKESLSSCCRLVCYFNWEDSACQKPASYFGDQL